jgi:hypothetical protein
MKGRENKKEKKTAKTDKTNKVKVQSDYQRDKNRKGDSVLNIVPKS